MVVHSRYPQETSVKSLIHLGQCIGENKFQDYNGYQVNWWYYHSWNPPQFDVRKIKNMPIAMYAGRQDPLATIADVDWLNTQLGNVVHYMKIDQHDHDFGASKTMEYMQSVIELSKKYNPLPGSL